MTANWSPSYFLNVTDVSNGALASLQKKWLKDITFPVIKP